MNIWKVVDELATDTRLKTLPYSSAAKYNSADSDNLRRTACLPDTRTEVMGQLRSWAYDDTSSKIYWLNGMAGTGKTTIAYSLCAYLESAGKLAASFFCSRQLPTCREANRILPSISYQLSMFSRPFRHTMSNILEGSPEAHNRPLAQQFEKLLAEPLQAIRNTLPSGLVIVIDALDECEEKDSIDRILGALILHISNLPVKFFVSSRPEPKILDRMRSSQGVRVQQELRLHELERSIVQEDIGKYLATKLAHIKPSATDLEKLTERSGSLFIYAATVVRYIGRDNFSRSKKRLKQVLDASLNTNGDQEIDLLYTAILEAALDDRTLEQSEKDEIKLVLHTVICAQEPLSLDSIASLLTLDDTEYVYAALRPLLSVLYVSDVSGLVTTLHQSFPEYMLNQNRSNQFCCNAALHHALLAQCCFRQIASRNPVFNICKLESSYLLDREVEDLDSKVANNIPQHLFYACRYWETHFEHANTHKDLINDLWDFLSVRFLFWMEVMNLKNAISDGAIIMHRLSRWLNGRNYYSSPISGLAADAQRFVSAFSASPASDSTPHIYISALALWPSCLYGISTHYLRKLSYCIRTEGIEMYAQDPANLVLRSSGDMVNCITYSPSGRNVAFGSEDGYVSIVDAWTGRVSERLLVKQMVAIGSVSYSPSGTQIATGLRDGTVYLLDTDHKKVAQILHGHAGSVESVAYSPDGAYIASGSADGTLRIWHADTGNLFGQPLQGHADVISSVVWSPDSVHIASGSLDGTIRIWDARTGSLVRHPLEGHQAGVTSIAYSPGGEHIASGSMDCTVRIWDAYTGHALGQPFLGHSRAVTTVSYLCNAGSNYVVSGSSDQTIRIWDVDNWHMVSHPIEGHVKPIRCISHSPNGEFIVSCAWDHTIRFWGLDKVLKLNKLDISLPGHQYFVHSVSCSPRGENIVSGSGDRNIYIWDSNTARLVRPPLIGHIGSVTSVVYTIDGRAIISGSGDNTIRVWNAETGQLLAPPLEGHTLGVTSIACSPDGAYFASASHDETIRIWDARTWEAVGPPIRGHTGWVTSVTYTRDGTRIVSGSDDLTIRIWDAKTRQMLQSPLAGHNGDVTSVACSPNGKDIASGSKDCTVRIWSVKTGQPMGRPLEGHLAAVRSVTYSPGGSYIISGSDDSTINIWDARTGSRVEQLEGHQAAVTSVTFSPDGKQIVSGSQDHAIRTWYAPSPTRLLTRPLGGCTDLGTDALNNEAQMGSPESEGA
ncbi:hypothetical protein FRC09_020445 [Ceratobasidium sp. 395]|nr:hypothetical protein FRC09_020445 [Ceratobasidium sp. 395]